MDAISRIPLRCDTPGEIGEIDTILYFDVVQMQSDTEYFIGCIVNLTEPAGSVTSPILPLNIIWSPADSQLIEPPGVMRMEANGGTSGEIDVILHIGIVQMQSNVEYLATCIINLTESPGSIISPVTMGSTNPVWSLIDPRLIEPPGIIDAKSNSVILDEVNIVLHFDVVQMQSDLEYFTDCVINLTESPGSIISPTSTGPVNAIWSLVNSRLIELPGVTRAKFNGGILGEIDAILYFDAVQMQSDLEYLADCTIDLTESPGDIVSPISTSPVIDSGLIEPPGTTRAVLYCVIPDKIDTVLYFNVVQMQSDMEYLADCIVNLTEVAGSINSIYSLPNIINSLANSRLIEPPGTVYAERDRHMINQVRLTGNMRQPQGVLTVETVGTSECSAFLIQISGKLQTKLVDDFKISLVESAGEIYGINIPSVDEARWLRSFMNNMGRGIN